jgi:ribosomal protein S21
MDLKMEVQVRKNNVTKALNLLNKKLAEDGDLRRANERRFYKPKSVKRRENAKAAKKRFQKELQKRMDDEYSR